MAPLIPVFVAVGTALGASAGTAAVVGGVATAVGAAAVVGGTAAVAHSMGKAKGAQKAASAMQQNGMGGASATDGASSESSNETGTNKTRSMALYSNGSSGLLGNATVGRRSLLAS